MTDPVDKTLLERRPVYAVLFASRNDVDAPYSPLASPDNPDPWPSTIPHGLDREVTAALPGLWYCLHMPSTFFELVDINARAIKSSQNLYLAHRIVLAPIQAFDSKHIAPWRDIDVPALVVCPDNIFDEARERSIALGFTVPPVRYSELSDNSLKHHWETLWKAFAPTLSYIGRELTLPTRLDIQPVNLPTQLLARQFGTPIDADAAARGDIGAMIDEGLSLQHLLAAVARLEEDGASPIDVERLLPEALEKEQPTLRLPVTVALPGVPSSYVRRTYGEASRVWPINATDPADTWSIAIEERTDAHIERAAIEFAATHSAVARHGLGVMLGSVPMDAFTVLAELERHCRGIPRGPQVWRMLARLNESAASALTEEAVSLIARAFPLSVFSNFPVGLLSLPGDTSPLSCRVPIAYRPMLPLTRTIQFELSDPPTVDFTAGFRVLVAECIPETDPVGRLSRIGWRAARDVVAQSDHADAMRFDYLDVDSVETLGALINEREPDLLVLSAHGALDRTASTAGVVVGGTLCLGPEFDRLPPVVILSACHVAPRGGGAVTITDLLLRQGALAVLGTQVPVDVRHNAMLMVRFFVYMMEVLAAREPHVTLLEIWHRVQTSNAINDVLAGSAPLWEWGGSTTASGLPVVSEFMLTRSRGAIQLGHVYRDTENVLVAIADEQGDGARIRQLLRAPGYVPESLFYMFAGRPDRILLRSPVEMPQEVWDEMRGGRLTKPG